MRATITLFSFNIINASRVIFAEMMRITYPN